MTHRIRRQILDLELPRATGAVELQRQAGRVFQEKVLPRLEAVFNKIAPADHFIRIKQLEIDLGSITEAQWESKFVESCIREITKQVNEAAFEVGTSGKTLAEICKPEENTLAVFCHFLESGALPWHAGKPTLKTLETSILEIAQKQPDTFRRVVLPVLKQKETSRRRLVWQFGPVFLKKLLEIALELPEGRIEQILQALTRQTRQAIGFSNWIALLEILLRAEPQALHKELNTTKILALLTAASTSAAKTRQPEQQFRPEDPAGQPLKPGEAKVSMAQPPPKKKSLPIAEEGIFTDLAGLVLLGVYLPGFFSELQLVHDGTFNSPDDQFRAIHLLYFLATGEVQPEEPVLALPKILCGLPIDEPVPLEINLAAAEKAEAIQLLEAAVRNWPALKNTGPDGLRTGFLQRAGLLYWEENQGIWLLKLERLGQDLLLERLPWTYSVIKTPWMETAIRVEW